MSVPPMTEHLQYRDTFAGYWCVRWRQVLLVLYVSLELGRTGCWISKVTYPGVAIPGTFVHRTVVMFVLYTFVLCTFVLCTFVLCTFVRGTFVLVTFVICTFVLCTFVLGTFVLYTFVHEPIHHIRLSRRMWNMIIWQFSCQRLSSRATKHLYLEDAGLKGNTRHLRGVSIRVNTNYHFQLQ